MKEIKHIGIIMDGNRRWAKERNLKPWEGHQEGAKTLQKIIKCLEELNIKEITLYTFSVQNFNRKDAEKKILFDLFIKEFSKLLDNNHKIHQKEIKINFLGRLNLFPEEIRNLAKKIMTLTKNYNKHTLNFAFGYGGREEIVDAVNTLLQTDKKEIQEKEFENYLYNKSQPEIIVRTGGEKRLSNFLTFQSAYSEIFFVDKYWPDFNQKDLKQILDEYNQRQRRFGK